MRAYADSSFILHLVLKEADSERVISEYRRAERPPLLFLPLHALEVRNAILQRAFHERRAVASSHRRYIHRETEAAIRRLSHLIAAHTLRDVTLDMDPVFAHAQQLSVTHTEKLGLRSIDILHVASALLLECELFLTTDARQARLAKAEVLNVISLAT